VAWFHAGVSALWLLPQSRHQTLHPLDTLPCVLIRATAFDRDHAVPAVTVQIGHAISDVIGIDAAAHIDLRAADTGFLAASRRCR